MFPTPTVVRRFCAALTFCGLAASASAHDIERERLSLVVDQIAALDRQLAEAQALAATAPRERYHFDYVRARADLERVRAGIAGFLTPARAQPRDGVDIVGDYAREEEK
jgi:RAQPRD family integrative conjugative element protein